MKHVNHIDLRITATQASTDLKLIYLGVLLDIFKWD